MSVSTRLGMTLKAAALAGTLVLAISPAWANCPENMPTNSSPAPSPSPSPSSSNDGGAARTGGDARSWDGEPEREGVDNALRSDLDGSGDRGRGQQPAGGEPTQNYNSQINAISQADSANGDGSSGNGQSAPNGEAAATGDDANRRSPYVGISTEQLCLNLEAKLAEDNAKTPWAEYAREKTLFDRAKQMDAVKLANEITSTQQQLAALGNQNQANQNAWRLQQALKARVKFLTDLTVDSISGADSNGTLAAEATRLEQSRIQAEMASDSRERNIAADKSELIFLRCGDVLGRPVGE